MNGSNTTCTTLALARAPVYDSNGNLTQDDLYKYKYDAENRMVELRLVNNTLVATYAYDGNSLRVIKVVGADRTWYLYSGTSVVSEFEDAASATYNSGTTPGAWGSWDTKLYQHSDHLTTRLTTENSGQLSNEQNHYPYGDNWYNTGDADPSVMKKFTSYEKDTEASAGQIHYAVFREHGARIGRFHSADPVRGRVRNPQRLNRYAYVTGDPANRRDLNGLDDSGFGPCFAGECIVQDVFMFSLTDYLEALAEASRGPIIITNFSKDGTGQIIGVLGGKGDEKGVLGIGSFGGPMGLFDDGFLHCSEPVDCEKKYQGCMGGNPVEAHQSCILQNGLWGAVGGIVASLLPGAGAAATAVYFGTDWGLGQGIATCKNDSDRLEAIKRCGLEYNKCLGDNEEKKKCKPQPILPPPPPNWPPWPPLTRP